MMPVRCSTDFRTKARRNTFDPGNLTYYHVINAEVPDIHRLMVWACRPSVELCSDSIESLLAIDDAPAYYRSCMCARISVLDGAILFRETSYKMWRICRVIDWHNQAFARRRAPWLCTDVQKAPVHSTRCTACFWRCPIKPLCIALDVALWVAAL